MKLASDLYAYEWTSYSENNCNSYYIGGKVGALIDPGLASFVPDLLAAMKDDGIRRENIRYVINTHSHPDHFEGSRTFTDDSVSIALHRDELAFLKGEGRYLYQMFGLQAPKVDVQLELEAGDAAFGEETLQILHAPGHSPGSIALYDPKRKALFCGDVIFDRNVGRTDFPGGDADLLKESIRRLARLDVEILLPGHMGIVEGRDSVGENFRLVMKEIFPYLR
ncbi:MAG: putative metallo-hydrolase [Syntrophaceae bacterium PtaU1.Bin231]|nr:MAG: putative metallo-hydrolase [Syntrophaceae bacterium PtaU1.Bin231]